MDHKSKRVGNPFEAAFDLALVDAVMVQLKEAAVSKRSVDFLYKLLASLEGLIELTEIDRRYCRAHGFEANINLGKATSFLFRGRGGQRGDNISERGKGQLSPDTDQKPIYSVRSV
jgi:hypothetical protein